MKAAKKVVHISTVHHPLDPRIYYKECFSLKKAGYNVTLIVPHESQIDNSLISILPLKKHHNKLKRMLFSTAAAFIQARKLKADYYHIHDPELLPVAWLLKKKNNVVIYDIHEDYVTSIKQKRYLSKPFRIFIAYVYKLLEKTLTARLELCLAEKYYKEQYPNGECILNYPILNEQFSEDGNRAKIDDRTNNLIYTGNVTVDRGAELHAMLPQLDDQISVYVIGKCSSTLAKKMAELAGESRDRLIIKGIDQYVPKAEIDDYYLNKHWLAGVAIFPPTEHYMKKELTKFFEYMDAGIPIICSDFPVWKQFIEKYQCGIVVNPHNNEEILQAINTLKSNPALAREMGRNGQKAVREELNWEAQGKKLVDWYERIWVEKPKG